MLKLICFIANSNSRLNLFRTQILTHSISYLLYFSGNKCFYFNYDDKTYRDHAKDQCETIRGHLPSIHSENEKGMTRGLIDNLSKG
jgi:hypothetical protein